jgi:hypothetical protein
VNPSTPSETDRSRAVPAWREDYEYLGVGLLGADQRVDGPHEGTSGTIVGRRGRFLGASTNAGFPAWR